MPIICVWNVLVTKVWQIRRRTRLKSKNFKTYDFGFFFTKSMDFFSEKLIFFNVVKGRKFAVEGVSSDFVS